jgi:hypothetical protein
VPRSLLFVSVEFIKSTNKIFIYYNHKNKSRQKGLEMTQIPLYYEAPLFIFVVLAAYSIYQLITIIKSFDHNPHKETYLWLIYATTFFAAWSLDHIFHDLYPLPSDVVLFFHYVISHGFLLLSMICIAVAATKTKKIHSSSAISARKNRGRNKF